MGRVQDRVVIVTGGAGGIGAAACRAIAAEGGKVVVADLDADGGAGRRGWDRRRTAASPHPSESTSPIARRCGPWSRRPSTPSASST